MPEYKKHEPGIHSFADLATLDFDAAIDFYRDLFGWEAAKQEMPEGGQYALMRVNGKDVSGVGTLQEEEKKQGIPPHWNIYVTVEDAEQAAKEVEAAGGTILVPSFDVMGVGNMAVVADPTGAAFCVWEPKTSIGAHVLGETNSISWTELSTTDTDKAGKFYAEVFGYELEPFGPPEAGYTVLKQGDTQVAGMMKAPEGMRSNWLVYFATDDVDEVVKKNSAGGGQTYMDPNETEGVGRFAVVADPQGAAFGVVTPDPSSQQ